MLPIDVIVRVASTTICRADQHELKADAPMFMSGRTLGQDDVCTAAATPMLLDLLISHEIDANVLIAQPFKLDQILEAHDTFAHRDTSSALKLIIEA
jgi:threonine dehydrogenase-like Zn-dependent dehydrogenase